MVKYFIFLFCWIAFAASAQELAFSTVKKLPAMINSNAEEVSPLASPDGKSLYFVRVLCSDNVGGRFGGADIWVSHYDSIKSTWGKPSNSIDVFNDKAHNAVVGISDRSDVIYQLKASATKKVHGIYYSMRKYNSWTQPELIPIPFLTTEEFLGVYVSPDLQVIIMSMKDADTKGQEDLYVSLKNTEGEWSRPLNLGSAINTAGFEISPFLTADRKRLYFASNGHPGLGDADIFYSDRLGDSWETWSVPVNLGNKINSKKFDAYFSIRDSIAYFCSNRDGQFSDLYKASRPAVIDSTQLRVKKIVAEAQTLLADLGDDGDDSIVITTLDSIFVHFDLNSGEMNRASVGQLNKMIDLMKKRPSNTLTLVAYSTYSNDFNADSTNDDLWYKRLEVIKTFLQNASVPNLNINYELKKQDRKERAVKDGLVLVRRQ
jgi:outer membrane protein OmpA-like peptidoglycan-associated protein